MRAREYDAWYETPRGRWIGEREYALLAAMLGARRGDTLLDVGCGTGYFTRRFSTDAGLIATGLDHDPEFLACARDRSPGISFVQGDAMRLPFADDAFDHAIAVTSLCFLADERKAVREMVRVARRRIAVGLLNRNSLLYLQKGRGGGQGAYHGARWHTRREALALFAGLGLEEIETATAVYLPGGGRFARWFERRAPASFPYGAFLVGGGRGTVPRIARSRHGWRIVRDSRQACGRHRVCLTIAHWSDGAS